MTVSLLAFMVAATLPATLDPCPGIAPREVGSVNAARRITADDLARLRDIGDPTYYQSAVGLSVSPDGRFVAFQMRRADPQANRYCTAMIVLPTDGTGRGVVVDSGGDLIRRQDEQWGVAAYPSGFPQVIKASWSSDGRSIAFLKRINGRTQAWVADVQGGGSRQVTYFDEDVVAVDWAKDVQGLRVDTLPVREGEAKLEKEGLTGFHLDRRFVPVSSMRPYLLAPLPVTSHIVATAGVAPEASQNEVRRSGGRATEWHSLSLDDMPTGGFPAGYLAQKAGVAFSCTDAACAGKIVGAWKSNDGRRVAYLRREGPADSSMGLYIWDVQRGSVERTSSMSGLLLGCEPAHRGLVCGYEAATQPREIVLIHPDTGHRIVLFDPNPEYGQFDLGSVRRLSWTNDRGIATFGDLVLPPGHKAGDRHPMIVVTYRSRGFLRGGVGDEFPIFPLAARGFAILSFDEPPDIASFAKTSSREEASAINRKDWVNRKSIQSSLIAGIEAAMASGGIDRDRIGITGLSEGASIAWFALINSRIFKAASISTCCEEPNSSMALLGEMGARHFENSGYPLLSQDDTGFWAPYSVARNAAKIDTPILLNLPDAETLYALESIRALRFWKKPVDAYVFPDEEHWKWQPAHRLAIYRRNIAWFDFWLRGVKPNDVDEASRWETLRVRSLDRADVSKAEPR